MGERICSVDGCERSASLPGCGRGLCSMHYQRWRKHGDVNHRRPALVGVGVAECSIDGCTAVVKSRGWCVKHWTRWQRFGDPEARLLAEVRDGKRICPGCRKDRPLDEWGKQSYCRACVNARRALWRTENPQPRVEGQPKACDCCGQAFLANGRRSRYCSAECFAANKNRANWKHLVARRTRLREAFVEAFDRLEIFERDGWICQICSEPVDRGARFPDPNSPSLDHIIPIARGGKHSRANAQTACLGCNVRKGDRLIA